ncbi:hypothetical protein T11_988 [Trichinella zimbabwensis]|uniref:Integrase catalytic domain-containing protein n=1 Tax=Trichinella zimbabwensis TaxID=268475 RepID=A0A0V1H908_9BILA|nr:hypothetical protein T11_988 [Trichinella zimbabwensis]
MANPAFLPIWYSRIYSYGTRIIIHLHSLGVVTSRTTAHNSQGNGQAERYNGIIWKAVTLALRSHHLRIEQWEEVIGLALHSLRTLLSTATNASNTYGYIPSYLVNNTRNCTNETA